MPGARQGHQGEVPLHYANWTIFRRAFCSPRPLLSSASFHQALRVRGFLFSFDNMKSFDPTLSLLLTVSSVSALRSPDPSQTISRGFEYDGFGTSPTTTPALYHADLFRRQNELIPPSDMLAGADMLNC